MLVGDVVAPMVCGRLKTWLLSPTSKRNGVEILSHWGGIILVTCTTHWIRVKAAIPIHPRYPSTCWMVQRLTSRRLASSRWLTPLDRSSRMYSRC